MSTDTHKTALAKLAVEIREIQAANGWNVLTFEDWAQPYKVPAVLALIHSEVSEALEAFRNNDFENFVEEIADVVIRALGCVGGLTTNFDDVVRAKLERNRQREYRHGNKRL